MYSTYNEKKNKDLLIKKYKSSFFFKDLIIQFIKYQV